MLPNLRVLLSNAHELPVGKLWFLVCENLCRRREPTCGARGAMSSLAQRLTAGTGASALPGLQTSWVEHPAPQNGPGPFDRGLRCTFASSPGAGEARASAARGDNSKSGGTTPSFFDVVGVNFWRRVHFCSPFALKVAAKRRFILVCFFVKHEITYEKAKNVASCCRSILKVACEKCGLLR